ncbi:P-loop containing nucleoside triphosphate hydrolase protein [Radiomyces spectabilis]|uniref:P-loop containing nucleoside triphosphate hydrolase protein n=1 Tax=Radiomyces spectabilis TaxID=64574 RepID=UPI00221F0CD7|nr:P-loop containing nucleoside triphosphate hydrolase protein [Radiomyces spectabilis]KAI8370637.1 P-loop containing nucleoside triphosphate hydrolase protein [Radiomyces spectabilis]
MPLKIIGAGLGRTGTHSLCTALEMLGYRTHHGTKLMTGPTEHLDVWMRAKQDPNHEDEWDRVYEGWDAAIDWPTCTFYKEIIEKYPDAKVILTVRSGDSWYDSMCKTIFRDIFLVKKEEVPEHVHRVAELCRAIMCDGDTADLENPERTRAKLVKFFDDHVEEVKRTVPADRLLIMELGEGWEKLCPFLGVDIPKEPYPRTNSSSQ